MKWIASLVGSGGENSGRLKTVDDSSTLLAGVGETFVPDSEIDEPCSVPLATFPLTPVQSAKSCADWPEASRTEMPSTSAKSVASPIATAMLPLRMSLRLTVIPLGRRRVASLDSLGALTSPPLPLHRLTSP
jgi:hypothetical protein